MKKVSEEIHEIADELMLVDPSRCRRLHRLAREVSLLEWAVTGGSDLADGVVDDLMRLGSLEGPLFR